MDTIDRVSVLEHVHDGGQPGARYAFMIIMACGIAMLGLLQNSVAVIIGAMLISPLMGPIVGLGYGAALNDTALLRQSAQWYLVSPTPDCLQRIETALAARAQVLAWRG